MKKQLKIITIFYLMLKSFSGFCQDSLSGDSLKPPANRKVRMLEKTVVMNASPEEVFAFMDDINNTGMHMTKSLSYTENKT